MSDHDGKLLVDRELQTPIDEFKAADFATGTLNSGHAQGSGLILISTSTSSVVRSRLLNMEAFNHNSNIVAVEFRDGLDGASTAPLVLGPIDILPNSGVSRNRDDLIGRYAASGLFGVILSGNSSQGVTVGMSFLREARDYFH